MQQTMERELEGRQAAAAPPRPRAIATPGVTSPSSPSFAAELASLKSAPALAPPPRWSERAQHAGAGAPSLPAPLALRPAAATADGVVDRDQDGRVDQWIFRQNGEIERIELDENGDGRADRVLHYDLETNQIHRVEEDADGDGASDSWTEYVDGRIARRRGDGDGDGQIDTWSFYRNGEISRHERDTSGDGFRDRTGYYRNGKLVREEHDRNGDGVPDAVIHYDSLERPVRREEDNDGDGRPDVISYYDGGKLARRELLKNEPRVETARP
jgi:antitoxin component YwqK of YwqJK toxin-antitoxin module